MAPLKLQGKPAIFTDYLDKSNLSHVGLKNSRAILETITGYSENEILFAMAAVDLYLCNRAPDLYTNHKALELLLMEKASQWDTHLTDRSLLEVVRKLSMTLRGYKLPAAISRLSTNLILSSRISPPIPSVTRITLSILKIGTS
ncbi:Aste57867_17146 [Aphanomyces stellatus]|uniref:Aste57867_17146 protein n=1 Tax=Aphanomyces stellatus TaxID=120398 RepID=A0A485LAP3_9STRA|nr:hypothetical protein As57867_017087 [Aphanomyces stellatus]VFT93903.1 Aste57867_17146 [Aphanomyces stellatus]